MKLDGLLCKNKHMSTCQHIMTKLYVTNITTNNIASKAVKEKNPT